MAFLIFCFCYSELAVTFSKIHFITTVNDIKRRNIRWALFIVFGVFIIIVNIFYRLYNYNPDKPMVFVLDLFTLTGPFLIEFVIFAVALFRIRKISLEHGQLLVNEGIMRWHILFFGSFVASTVSLAFATQRRENASYDQTNLNGPMTMTMTCPQMKEWNVFFIANFIS